MYNQPESSLTLIVDSIFGKPFFDRHILSATMCLLAFIENLLEETVNACCFQFLPPVLFGNAPGRPSSHHSACNFSG